MAKQCAICGKGAIKAGNYNKLRGQYNPSKRKKQKPNLQKVRLPSGKKVLACTKCIKAMSK